jgi:hypothetical protein
MKDQNVVAHCDPDILDGTPVFVGTRVPVKARLDYLAGGHTLDDFLGGSPYHLPHGGEGPWTDRGAALKWPGLRSPGMVEATRTVGEKTTVERRY